MSSVPRSRDRVAGSAVRRAPSPAAYAASISRASWLVATAVSSSPPAITCPWYVADRMPSMPMAATAITRSVPKSAISETVAALANVAFTST